MRFYPHWLNKDSRRGITRYIKKNWSEIYHVKLERIYDDNKNKQRLSEAEKWLNQLQKESEFLWFSDQVGRRWWFNNPNIATAFKLKFYRS